MSFSYRLACFFSHPMRMSCVRRFLRVLIPLCGFSRLRRRHLIRSSHPFRLACRPAPHSRALRFSSLKRRIRMIHSGRRTGRKTGRPSHNEERPEKRNEIYTIKREAAN